MKKYIVTIAREHGSGGRIIGKKLAEELGIAFYDRELITLTAKQTGLSEAFINDIEDQKPSSLLYSLYMGTYIPNVYDEAYVAQANLIRSLADKESCVIVGRCADYILREYDNCFHFFIHAPIQERAKRITEEYGEQVKDPAAAVKKWDKKRSSYYNFVTQSQWGRAQNYNLTIDSSIGLDQTTALIKDYLKHSGVLD
ncbi:MAG: cytidylate kinase-like family protein [Oscillospiraceae bacterium]|nr:cytidylate kinase-like family protein [Oscillospiraceae bacterium]MDD7429199.1 cytidylate kinase-like family protein [Oscillospiraceae bacterium]MDY2847402.1 cytidylate kinase-like family protein [Oscillospiraceae bacterium]